MLKSVQRRVNYGNLMNIFVYRNHVVYYSLLQSKFCLLSCFCTFNNRLFHEKGRAEVHSNSDSYIGSNIQECERSIKIAQLNFALVLYFIFYFFEFLMGSVMDINKLYQYITTFNQINKQY